MKRCHSMPFGAEILADGRVRFRLWAPSAERVELCLRDAEPDTALTMVAEADGWWGLVTTQARPWSLYAYRVNDQLHVPDPASRYQPNDVHGASQVVDPTSFDWGDADWQGRPWHEAVIYELHVGTFTQEGTFSAAKERLDYLVELGVTAIELMPVADFPGARDWGYDGALLFAPDSVYGQPDDLKDLINAAHSKGVMVLLDVVYNHFGPEGNYLHTYASSFFTDRHHTPWGAAINFDGPGSAIVREFFIHNALYWLEEYHFDGLRLDAVHAIVSDSQPDILDELAQVVRARIGSTRHVHLVLENDRNAAHYLQRNACGGARGYDAQWNDDLHHVLHILLTGESDGYYADYVEKPLWYLGRCLTEGFAYQGEASVFRGGAARGEASSHLPATAFVSFLQTHDQVGNRAFGERIHALAPASPLRAAAALILLAPMPPLLFMGEEFGAVQPFLFFCDFGPDLVAAVAEGRRREFERLARFADATTRTKIPDPNAPATFTRCRLDWNCLAQRDHAEWLAFYRELLTARRREIEPRLARFNGDEVHGAGFTLHGQRALTARWSLADGSGLAVFANFDDDIARVGITPRGKLIHVTNATDEATRSALAQGTLPPWSVTWIVATAEESRS